MGKIEDKNVSPSVYINDCYRASPGLSCNDCTSQALFRAHMGNLVRQHLLGPILTTVGLLNSKLTT